MNAVPRNLVVVEVATGTGVDTVRVQQWDVMIF